MINLNANANTHLITVGFQLFKLENIPAIGGGVDGEEGERCYERSRRAYKEMQECAVPNVYAKYFTDYTLGVQNRGFVPRLREQLIHDPPSVDEADYILTEKENEVSLNSHYATPLGEVHARTIAQLTPLIVNLQSHVIKNFAMRVAAKLGVSAVFVMVRLILPFFIASPANNRVIVDQLSCVTGEKETDLSVACFTVSYITHETRFILYTFFVLVCDLAEAITTMRRLNAGAGNDKHAHMAAVVNDAHARWIDNYMTRFMYTAFAIHIGLRGWDVVRSGFNVAFGVFNEKFCSGDPASRPAHLCYKYNKTVGQARML